MSHIPIEGAPNDDTKHCHGVILLPFCIVMVLSYCFVAIPWWYPNRLKRFHENILFSKGMRCIVL
jgi:hypothetical protein